MSLNVHAFYINLDKRTDRKAQVEAELESVGLSWTRIPGILIPGRPPLGCSKAHCSALRAFLKTDLPWALICEDDFQVHSVSDFQDTLKTFFEDSIQFDVVMLAAFLQKESPGPVSYLKRVKGAQTTSAYLVSRSFAPTLLENFEESTSLLEAVYDKTGYKKHEVCLDIYWQRLQETSTWYMFCPRISHQRESYSDIEMKVVKYDG